MQIVANVSLQEPGTHSSPEAMEPACAAPAMEPACAASAPANNAISAAPTTDAARCVETEATSASPAPTACSTAPGEPSLAPAVDGQPAAGPAAVPAAGQHAAEGACLLHAERPIPAEDMGMARQPELAPSASAPPFSSLAPTAQQQPVVNLELKASS